jgi:hypothetical protein
VKPAALQCSNRASRSRCFLLQSRQLLLQLTLFLFGHQLPEIAKLACGRESIAFYPCSFKSVALSQSREGVNKAGIAALHR